jgi:hypothetical protein
LLFLIYILEESIKLVETSNYSNGIILGWTVKSGFRRGRLNFEYLFKWNLPRIVES